jgi:hypothetical protein
LILMYCSNEVIRYTSQSVFLDWAFPLIHNNLLSMGIVDECVISVIIKFCIYFWMILWFIIEYLGQSHLFFQHYCFIGKNVASLFCSSSIIIDSVEVLLFAFF